MNREGFGSNGSAFEYTVSMEGGARTLRRALLLAGYVVWTVLFFTVGILTRILLPLLCFIPLSLWILVFFTWRFSKKEIKLSFFVGKLTVTRLYDGKNPKVLMETLIKELPSIEHYHAGDAYRLKGKRVIYATKTNRPEHAYLAVKGDTALLFEANEQALKILKYYQGSSSRM